MKGVNKYSSKALITLIDTAGACKCREQCCAIMDHIAVQVKAAAWSLGATKASSRKAYIFWALRPAKTNTRHNFHAGTKLHG